MSEKMAEIKKLRNIQLDLENNLNFLMENLKDPTIGLLLLKQSEERIPDICRNIICKNIQDTILECNKMIEELKEKIANVKSSEFESLRRDLLNVEVKIKNTKQEIKTKIDEFMEEEIALDMEIAKIAKRLQNNESISIQSKLKNNHSVSKEITEFSKFVFKNIGEDIVWTTDAQKILFDVTRRYKSKEKVLEALKTFITDLSEENLKAHEDCFDQFVEFSNKKKETLKKWRESKQKQENKKENVELELKERKIQNFIRTNPETRQKILLWKAEKNLKLIQQEELKTSHENKQRETEKLKRFQQEKTKEEIDKRKLERQTKFEQEEISKKLLEQRQHEYKSKLANKMIKEFQHQDDLHVKRILDERQKRTNVKAVVKNCVTINRNPEDLMKPTKQWLARTEVDNQSKNGIIPNLEHINKLAVPDWRKTQKS